MLSARGFITCSSPQNCHCKLSDEYLWRRRVLLRLLLCDSSSRRRWRHRSVNMKAGDFTALVQTELSNLAKRSARGQRLLFDKQSPGDGGGVGSGRSCEEQTAVNGNLVQVDSAEFTNYREDPLMDKMRTQLGIIHPIPSPSVNSNIVGFFVFFFFIGVVFDKLWTSKRLNKSSREVWSGMWSQVPTSFSMFLEKDLQRKESVEWVNMVLGKLWKVHRSGIENWIIGLLQPVIDDLRKPGYVQRVEIKQFSLGDEPLSVRNVERRTSRRANDLQYHIGLRYTGGARMLLSLSLKFGIVPIVVPVGVRDFDIDGELWVKLRLIPTEPYVGAVTWAFVYLPKIKVELSPFRLFNLMGVPVVSMFLRKLLTEDLPRLFVRPKKIVLDFQKGKAVGPVSDNFDAKTSEEGSDFVGELSVTLVDAHKLTYVGIGKTDPYVVLRLGDQVIRSKKNSQTTVIGPPGEPIWNQDFLLFVANPSRQTLKIEVIDSVGFGDFTLGTGVVELGSLKDTVPSDRVLTLQGGWRLFGRQSSGEIMLRLTYRAYVEDEEDDSLEVEVEGDSSDDDALDHDTANGNSEEGKGDPDYGREKESFMDVLAALLVSEEFRGIVASETGYSEADDESNNPILASSRKYASYADNTSLVSETKSVDSTDMALIWLAAITIIAVLIALNISDSGFFNP